MDREKQNNPKDWDFVIGVPVMYAIYLRVSTDKQELGSQRVTIYDWAAKQGYRPEELVEYVDEAISGARSDRPGLIRLLQDAEKGKIKKVLAFDTSRLSRDFMGMLEIMNRLSTCGVELEVPNRGIQGFDSSVEKLVMAVRAFQSSQFLEDHSNRVKAGINKFKHQRPGEAWGRARATENRLKDYKADLGAKVWREILKRHAAGESIRAIAASLGVSPSKVYRIVCRSKTPKSS